MNQTQKALIVYCVGVMVGAVLGAWCYSGAGWASVAAMVALLPFTMGFVVWLSRGEDAV